MRTALTWLLCFMLGAAAGWYVQGERWDADVAKRAEAQGKAAREAKEAADAVLQATQQRLTDASEAATKERLKNAAEIARLDRCLRSGGCGLFVAAKCPSVPADADAPGVDPPGTARLTAVAESDYLEFQRLYAEQLETLKDCKAFADPLH